MTKQQRGKRANVARGLKRVEIVRMLSQSQPLRSELIKAFAVANAHSTPVVAFEDDEWPRKCNGLRLRLAAKEALEYSVQE